MTKTSTCFSLTCGHVVPGSVATCPKCGSKMRTSKTIRILGGLMLACGLLLIGLMGTITLNIAPQMLHPGQEIGGSTWNGTAEQGRMALTLFSMVIAFGLVATLTGLWQIATGQRSRIVLVVVILLAVALFAYARYLTGALDA